MVAEKFAAWAQHGPINAGLLITSYLRLWAVTSSVGAEGSAVTNVSKPKLDSPSWSDFSITAPTSSETDMGPWVTYRGGPIPIGIYFALSPRILFGLWSRTEGYTFVLAPMFSGTVGTLRVSDIVSGALGAHPAAKKTIAKRKPI